MIEVTIHSDSAVIKAVGSIGEQRASAGIIRSVIDSEDRQYIGYAQWRIKNPWKYSERIPALGVALEDAQRQMGFLSAKDIASVQDQKYAEFFYFLTNEEQLIILECAVAGLRDELADGWLRENDVLNLDLSDEVLEPIHDKLDDFLDE